MKQVELKINVLIHKVKLQVRFPCSLAVTLKIQNDEVSFGQEVPLRVGEAVLQLSAHHKFSIYFDALKNQFAEKKIALAVYLKSSSGRIPAGAAYINLNAVRQGREILSIEKCPDKDATIQTSINYDVLNQIDLYPSSEQIHQISLENQIFTHRSPKETVAIKSKSNSRSKNSEIGHSHNYSNTQSKQSEDFSMSEQRLQGQGRSKYQVYQQNEIPPLEFKHSMIKVKPEISSNRQYQSNKYSSDYGLKFRNGELQREVKNLQKKYQQIALQLKTVIIKKEILEKSLKQTEGQLKIYKQKYQDSHQSNQSMSKKFQYKQNNYKEQIKALTDKLSTLENDRQRMIFEKNDMVTQFQEREKNLRFGFKEKEKQFAEERNKLTKKIQQLTKDSTDNQNINNERETKIKEFMEQIFQQKLHNDQQQIKIQQLTSSLQSYKQSLIQQQAKVDRLKNMAQNNQQVEEEKKKLRKKINEMEQQISKHLKNITNLDINMQKATKRAEEAEFTVKQKINSLKLIQKELQNANKQSQNSKKIVQQKDRRLQQLSLIKQNQSIRLENLSEQKKQIQRKYQQQFKSLKRQSKEKDLLNEGLRMELEQNNETIINCNSKILELQIQISEVNNSINILQQEHQETLRVKSQLEIMHQELEIELEAERMAKNQLQMQARQQKSTNANLNQELQDKLHKLEAQLESQEENYSFKIQNLERKIQDYQKELKKLSQEFNKKRQHIQEIEMDQSRRAQSNQQLKYNLKLKNNEVTFLKQQIEKLNQQITQSTRQSKSLVLEGQRLKDQINELSGQIQCLNGQLKEASSSGNNIQVDFIHYKVNNKLNILNFVNSLTGTVILDHKAEHEDADIKEGMTLSIQNIISIISRYEKQIQQLNFTLSLEKKSITNLESYLQQKKIKIQQLTKTYNEQIYKNSSLNQSSDFSIKQLKNQLEIILNQNKHLDEQVSKQKGIQNTLSQQLQTVNNAFQIKSQENESLQTRVRQLEYKIQEIQKHYNLSQTEQTSKFQEEINFMNQRIIELQSDLQILTDKSTDLNSKLAQKTKQFREYQRESKQEIVFKDEQIQRLNIQLSKLTKELEVRSDTIANYLQIQETLRNDIQISNKEILALKQMNDNIQQNNEKRTDHEKELEDFIRKLEKQLSQKTAEHISKGENIFKLEKEKQKLVGENQILIATLKVKQDAQMKTLESSKSLHGDFIHLQQQLKLNQKKYADKEAGLKKQLSVMIENKDKLYKQLNDTKQKLEDSLNKLSEEGKNSSETSKQQARQINQLRSKNKQNEDKIVTISKALLEQQQTHSLQHQYLKPVKQNLSLLRGHLAEYSRTSDQFESSKNKLLKIATTKIEQYNQKFITERVRDLSFAYSKLKVYLLNNNQLSQIAKAEVAQQIKKVQLALDRILRGEK